MPNRFINFIQAHFVSFTVLVNLITILVVAFALILPMRASVAAQKVRLVSLRQDLEIKQQRARFDEQNKKGLALIAEADLQKLDALFAEGATSPSIFAAVEALAQGAHFTPTSIDIAQTPTGGGQGGGNLQIAVQLQGGSYFELKELIKAILLSAPLLDASSLTFAGENAGITLNLKAYALDRASAPASLIDFALFSDPRFNDLRVSSAPFEQGAVGRSNPFSPPSE